MYETHVLLPFNKLFPCARIVSQGSMEFRDYAVRYRPELELVLREFNAKIEPREKVGVVGR